MNRFWPREHKMKTFLQNQDWEKYKSLICLTNLLIWWQGSHVTCLNHAAEVQVLAMVWWISQLACERTWCRGACRWAATNQTRLPEKSSVTWTLLPGVHETAYWVVPQAEQTLSCTVNMWDLTQQLAAWAWMRLQDCKQWSMPEWTQRIAQAETESKGVGRLSLGMRSKA